MRTRSLAACAVREAENAPFENPANACVRFLFRPSQPRHRVPLANSSSRLDVACLCLSAAFTLVRVACPVSDVMWFRRAQLSEDDSLEKLRNPKKPPCDHAIDHLISLIIAVNPHFSYSPMSSSSHESMITSTPCRFAPSTAAPTSVLAIPLRR